MEKMKHIHRSDEVIDGVLPPTAITVPSRTLALPIVADTALNILCEEVTTRCYARNVL